MGNCSSEEEVDQAVKRVLLLGQPNVGKSSLLRRLTGANVTISNYPGTTVEVSRATTHIGGVEYEFIDTPGIYSFYPSSIEEEVTERSVLTENYDFAVVVIDATVLERGLAFLLSVAELGVPLVAAVNFWEEAESRGIWIDYGGLERALGIPFVRVNPTKRGGVEELKKRLSDASRSIYRVVYDDDIERAIERAVKCVGSPGRLSGRGLAVRLVEGDRIVEELYGCPHAVEARRWLEERGHDPHNDIEVTRAGHAQQLARRYVSISPRSHVSSSRLDRALLEHPSLGAAFSFLLVVSLIFFVVELGSLLVGWLNSLFSPAVEEASRLLEGYGLAGYLASKTIVATYAQYTAALPYVFLFYISIVVLEDSGLLARVMIWIHGLAKRIGLHSKGVIPVLMGLGCSVPATTGTRILPSLRQRIVAISMLAFIPCSSRATIIFGVAGRYIGVWAPLAIYLFGFLLAIMAGWLVARATNAREDAVLIEDIPPLRRPLPGNVYYKTWARLRDFVLIVTPLVMAGAMIYAALDYYGYTSYTAFVLEPVARLVHLPTKAVIPIIYGFVQKDLVISMLAASLGTIDFSRAMSLHQLMTFTILSTYQVPCIIALGAMIREIGARRAVALWIGLGLIGLTIAVLYSFLPLPP